MTHSNDLGELDTLLRVLRQFREVIRWKLHGLAEEEARRPAVASGTNPLALVKHLGFTEREWFQKIIGRRVVFLPFDDANPDGDWVLDDSDTVESVIAFYEAECAVSDAMMAEVVDPTALVPLDDGYVTVRRVVVHMLEETARHAGHMDIMREQIDGSTGAFPE